MVAGHTRSEVIFEILGTKGKLTPQQLSSRDRYLEGLTAYRERRWDDAIRALNAALEASPATGRQWRCSGASKTSRQTRRRRTGTGRGASTNKIIVGPPAIPADAGNADRSSRYGLRDKRQTAIDQAFGCAFGLTGVAKQLAFQPIEPMGGGKKSITALSAYDDSRRLRACRTNGIRRSTPCRRRSARSRTLRDGFRCQFWALCRTQDGVESGRVPARRANRRRTILSRTSDREGQPTRTG